MKHFITIMFIFLATAAGAREFEVYGPQGSLILQRPDVKFVYLYP